MTSLNLAELIIERSKRCDLLSSPLRNYIITFIAAKGDVAWSDLKSSLEQHFGSINPNTLSFHIGVLLDAGFVDKSNINGQPKYLIIRNKLSEIESLVGKDLIEKMKEEIKKYNIKVEILKIDSSNQGYSVSGNFKVIPFFITKSGSFAIMLDENLEIISFNLKEE